MAGLTALLLAVTGVVVGSASPAAAAFAWQDFYGLTSNWHCSTTVGEKNYAYQACVVVSGTNYQGVLLLKSYSWDLSFYGVAKNVESTVVGQSRECDGYIDAGTIKACFAPTVTGTVGNAVQGKVWVPYIDSFSPSIMLPH